MPEFALTIDLSNCDREPIHIPGSIQPHGVLLVVEPEATRILQVAGDTERILGRDIDAILGRRVADVVGARPASLIDPKRGSPKPAYLGSINVPDSACRPLDLTRPDRDGILILEIERSSPRTQSAADVLAQVRGIAAEIRASAGSAAPTPKRSP